MSGKAGILTFHRARNYGAVLQAYALQKKVQKYCETDIIDYQNDEINRGLKVWTGDAHRGLKQQIRAIAVFFYRLRKKIAFDQFIEHEMICSEAVEKENLKELSKRYDILISGSDQVWNNELTDTDNSYFLDFASEKVKKLAYSVSMGDASNGLTEEQIALVESFDLVTVREKQAAKYLGTQIEKDIQICCDPTLLLTAEEWEKITSKKLEKKKYIFLFMIEEQQDLIEYATEIARREGAKLISNKKSISFWLHPSPKDFLSWIFYAEYVITNSFHGTVFSLLFHRPFACSGVIAGGKPKNRIVELLKLVNLANRLIENTQFQIESPIDWNLAEEQITNYRENSWTVLQKQIEEIGDM
ncbi:MAG: polysaccharide pyruvyl transferase family protein [Bacteroidales bacterium]|nr:polysaccharide pyruvyl transferase family protein [Lachnoclostridium sp.]MCM1384120.1 polysaccharide pyruvyl transferase family protein [Lachnoclostridium sp.]MCM1465680.1 polysaccharide pyruvyl transferase family protein [Bacteroidales bacterium]